VTLRGPTAYRIFNIETPWAEKYKHLIEPTVTYRYVTDFDEQDSLLAPVTLTGGRFDGIDTFDRSALTGTVGVNELTYRLTTRLLAKGAKGNVGEIFRFMVSQTFDVKEYRKNERTDLVSLGPIRFDVESRPVPFLIANARTSYDYGHERLANLNGTVGLEVGRYGMLFGDYVFSQSTTTGETLQSFYSGAAGLNLTDAIHAQYRIRYDERDGLTLENQYSLVYRGCCWSVQVTLFDRIDETKALFMLDLRGIGSVGRRFHVGSDVGGKRRGERERMSDTLRQSIDSHLQSTF
jgi:lipopolysaccharide assembly outer membrane protein LptD (OstA)